MTNLHELINVIKSNHVIIRMHNFPDPDAIASAFGLQDLLKKVKQIDSTICYNGKIDKFSTVKMIELLNISIVDVEELSEEKLNSEVILVDAQRGNANIEYFEGDDVICIDHHPTFEKVKYLFSDIRSEVGACASIIAEYYFRNKIDPDKNVATALLYGIKIDTANLTRGVSDLDLDMFYLLYKKSDLSIINSIESSLLQISDLSAYHNAIRSIEVYNKISFANTGKDCPEALIAMVSDFMLSLHEVEFSVVYSIKNDGIKISVRSEFNGYDAGKISYYALKEIGSGGGHENMAGGFISFDDSNMPLQDIVETIKEKFIEAADYSEC